MQTSLRQAQVRMSLVPGLIATTNEQSVCSAIDDILLVAEYMPEEEIRGQVVVFPPFRG